MTGRRSRHVAAALYSDKEDTSLGTRGRIDTTPRPDDRFHTVVSGDQVDLLAARYLGQAELWAIVCDYNDIFFLLELEFGAVLRISSAEHTSMQLIE